MKKVSLLVLCCAIATMTIAQGVFFNAGFGYAFAVAGQSLDGSGAPYNGTLNNTTQAYNIKSASFSSGLQAKVGFGYMANKNVGVMLDASIGLLTKKYKATIDGVSFGSGSSSYPGSITFEQQAILPMILMPSLVMQSEGKKWGVYSRFGIALPLNTHIILDQIQTNAPGTGAISVDDFTMTIKSSFSLGFSGAAGVKYKVSDRLSLWGEVSGLSLSVYIKQSHLTAFTHNGQSYSTTQVSGNQTVNYSKNVTVDSTGANLPSYSIPFSNMGINFGISLSLGRHSHRSNVEATKPGKPGKSERPKPSRFK
jgi:outer membrane protein W